MLDPSSIPVPANQIIIQVGDAESVYLTFGHVNPPVFDGIESGAAPTPEMLSSLTLAVIPVSQILLPFSKLVELREKIDGILGQVQESAK